ncbi:TonB-dependent receptor [Fulvivirgaceae bacterium BMA10]|uniref:TonB-dependent receptor n=1 Tax=Splendidivirga corallicola TaxID=3051826 RepID=A0ABT8KPT0_9BACT|nr:TonB-dependent receptor [Fulvivirgaceae bacterium BMA10]
MLNITLLWGQHNTVVTVLAIHDDSPLIGTTLQPVEQSSTAGWVTNMEGKAYLNITQPTLIRVSSIGYLTIEKLISPGQSIKIKLEEDVLGLEEVVVTGSFVPTTSARSLYAVKKLDASIIEARGSVNLGDALQTQLNLKTIQDDVLGTRVVMQGISGPNVKMLIDGVPLVNGAGGEFDLSQINMNNVERVEIVEGPLSVQYGTNALAGTINVITKNYAANETSINPNAYAESVGQYNADVVFAKGWKNLSVSLSAARNQFDGFSSTGERKENWIPRTQYLGNVKVKTSFKSLNITGSYDQMWQDGISHGNATSSFNNRTGRLSEVANDNYFNTRRLNGSLIVDGKLSDKQYIHLVNGVSRFKQSSRKFIQDVIDDVRWLSTNIEDHDTTSFTTWTFRGTYVHGNTRENKGAYITAGYEASINTASGGRISADADGSVNEYGLFTAVEVPLSAKVKVQPALRYIYSNSYDTKDIDFLGADLPLLPSLNIMYSKDRKFDIRFSYGQGYRTPSVRELFYEFIDANHYIVGNRNLQPEVGHNLNASATWRTTIGKITAAFTPSVFFSQIDNKIDLIQILDRETLPDEVPKNVPVARVYDNIPNFKAYGINLAGELVAQNGIRLSPGFGLLARSGSEADDKFFRSYEANMNAGYFLKQMDVKFNVFYKYNGRISEFARKQDGSIGVLTLEDYHTLDASLSKTLFNGRLFTTIGAKNIFNVTDISLTGDGSKGLVLQTGREAFYPISWGRTFFIKINYTIQ